MQQDWVRSHTLLLTMPKTTDTTITEVSVHNQVRPSVVATTVVPNEDVKRYNGYGGKPAPEGLFLYSPAVVEAARLVALS